MWLWKNHHSIRCKFAVRVQHIVYIRPNGAEAFFQPCCGTSHPQTLISGDYLLWEAFLLISLESGETIGQVDNTSYTLPDTDFNSTGSHRRCGDSGMMASINLSITHAMCQPLVAFFTRKFGRGCGEMISLTWPNLWQPWKILDGFSFDPSRAATATSRMLWIGLIFLCRTSLKAEISMIFSRKKSASTIPCR